MTDSQLLAEYVDARDPQAFGELVRRYERLVWSTCQRVLNNRCDVEDAFQTTFLLLATKAHRIRKPESLSNWIYGVAWRTSTRLRKSRVVESLEQPDEISDPSESPLESLARQYEIDLVDQRIQTMREPHRTPLVLHYFAGLTANQIADQLNLSVAAVEGRLRRARASLRTELQCTGIQASPVAVIGLLATRFVSRPDLVVATTERCVATGASTIAGATTSSIGLGANLMIVKTICVAGVTIMLTLIGFLHTSSTSQESNPVAAVHDVSLNLPADQQDDVEITLTDAPDDEHSSLELHEMLHHHLMEVHSHLELHVEKLHEMFGDDEEGNP